MHRLSHRRGDGGEVVAVVHPVGAALVGLRVGGLDVVQPLADPTDPPLAAGATLAPWPNRVRDGRWSLDGVPQQLDVTDPVRRTAIHGLVRHARFARGPDPTGARLRLSTVVTGQPGYPFTLALTMTYTLRDDGVEVRYDVRNAGAGRAPFAVGAHPYLVIGAHPTEELVLTVPARTVLVFDERALPVGREAVRDGTDLRAGRPVGQVPPNRCFTDLDAADGGYACTVAGPDAELTVWGDAAFRYWQIFNPADFPGPCGPVRALAVEPMTAPPDALNSGEGLRWLAPEESWACRWGLRVTRTCAG